MLTPRTELGPYRPKNCRRMHVHYYNITYPLLLSGLWVYNAPFGLSITLVDLDCKVGGAKIVLRRRRRRESRRRRCRGDWCGERVSPSPADMEVWGSVVSSPSRVWGEAPAENDFSTFCSVIKRLSLQCLLLFNIQQRLYKNTAIWQPGVLAS